MFVWAYQQNPAATFIINDLNKDIVGIYKAIKNSPDPFIMKLDELSAEYLPLEKEERKKYFYKLRNENAYDYEKWNETEQAAVLYFLMKTAFNGIWQINKNTNGRFGTPSGLLNQKDKVYDKSNVLEWHEALKHCIVLSDDFTIVKPMIDDKTFLFMDPPYRGSFTQYGVDFNDDEQRRAIKLLEHCQSAAGYGLLSNRDVGDGFFKQETKDMQIVEFDVTYTAGRRKKTEDGFKAKKAKEVLIKTSEQRNDD
jgi:DNA adenine methylase